VRIFGRDQQGSAGSLMALQVGQILLAVVQVEHLHHSRLKCHSHQLDAQRYCVVQRLVLPL